MSTIPETTPKDLTGTGHVTIRRGPNPKPGGMALRSGLSTDLPNEDGSLLIDSILTQAETNDVVSMMMLADEMDDCTGLPSFCTSTQMGNRNPQLRPVSPPLSPMFLQGHGARGGPGSDGPLSDSTKDGKEHILNEISPDAVYNVSLANAGTSLHSNSHVFTSQGIDIAGKLPNSHVTHELSATNVLGPDVTNTSRAANSPRSAASSPHDVVDATEWPVSADDGSSDAGRSEAGDQGVKVRPETGTTPKRHDDPDLFYVASKVDLMEELITLLDNKTTRMDATVTALETSLEFSQSEVEILKKENKDLKQQLCNLNIEDRRTQFQVNAVEEKVDRLETNTKKRNLLVEGIMENGGRDEDVEKTICQLFDQLAVSQGISMESCYRVGPYNNNKTRPRPILICFDRQVDRDVIYAKGMMLKSTKDYKRVWINEDVGPISKRKRGLIRLISREAQQQGIDCRTGKYAIHIDNKKYDADNLDDLPRPLHPASLKQIKIGDNTLAYQGEFAPFSNFFPCKLVIGKLVFFCVEQAFQFLRAKNLNRPLIATKIYLSRDVWFIKQQGKELGTSEDWEGKQFDVMYECLKKKFSQNLDLKTLLLKTGNLELVEATPDRLWGCGATLSSNAIHKRDWPGQNKHGQILMTIRQELQRLDMA